MKNVIKHRYKKVYVSYYVKMKTEKSKLFPSLGKNPPSKLQKSNCNMFIFLSKNPRYK